MTELCFVDYGSHIGEYTKQKITATGRSVKWVAEQLNTSRENFYKSWMGKAEWVPSQIMQLEGIMGDDFFQEFFEKNPKLKPYRASKETFAPNATSAPPMYGKSPFRGSGYSISIEIDPVNFNPDHMDPLSESLKKALEDFREKIKKDEM